VFNNGTGGKLVNVGGQEIAVFKLGEDHYAIENTSPHAGGPLAEGEVEDDVVTCSWHGSRFNIKTGALLAPPAK
jgi:nitrite reductase/ring-hydroxylating ferredoxin subunit